MTSISTPKLRLVKNAANWAAALAIFNALAGFIQYKIVYNHLGSESLGLWSLVLASVSIGKLAELGLTSGLLRHLSLAVYAGDYIEANRIIETTLLATLILTAFAALVIYFPGMKVFTWGSGLNASSEYRALMTIALLTFVANTAMGVIASSHDALFNQEGKAKILLITQFAYTVYIYISVSTLGLQGVAYGQLVQAYVATVLLWITLRHQLEALPLLPHHIYLGVLRKVGGYTVKYQGIMIGVLLVEPLTKTLVARYFGLSTLGHFELVNQIFQKIRAPIVGANQSSMPLFVDQNSRARMQKRLLRANLNRTDLISLIAISIVLSGLPLASLYFTGKIHSDLCAFGVVLGLSHYFSLRITSYYVVAMARGYLGIIAVYHLMSGIILFLLGWVGCAIIGPKAIYLAIVVSALAPAMWLRWQAQRVLNVGGVSKISSDIMQWLVRFYKAGCLAIFAYTFLIMIALDLGDPIYYMFASLANMIMLILLIFFDQIFIGVLIRRAHRILLRFGK